MGMKYLLLLISMSLAICGQFLLKKGVSLSNLTPNFLSIVSTIFNPLVFLGLVIYALSSVVWLFVLQKFPLSVAYPSLALTYIVVVLMSVFILKESFTLIKLLGVVLIFSGVFCLYR